MISWQNVDYKALSDGELIACLQAGDRLAFDHIYRKYWSGLYDQAYSRCRDKEACRDMLQNVFTDLWLRRDQLTIVHVAAYLHTAVRFQSYSHISRKPQQTVYLDFFEETLCSPVQADDLVREAEIKQLVECWLAALPKKRREIFLLYYTEELPTREIADRLQVSQKTVQSQLYVATKDLRARLSQFLSLALLIDLISRR